MVSNLRKNFLCIVWHQKPTVTLEVNHILYRQLKYVLSSLKVQAVYVEKISAQQRRGKGTTYDAHFLLSSTKEFDTTVQLMPLGRGTKMTIGRTRYYTQCTVMNFVNFLSD